jgi:DNA-binding transcriptional LysR family regulator
VLGLDLALFSAPRWKRISVLAWCLIGRIYAIIGSMELRGIDLNLLVSLRVLLTQRHVTRSAEKLGPTQPAMSASLARSRTLFRDRLLVCGPQGLVLTPRGEQILEQLNKIMEVTERLIAVPGEFTPETCNRTFALRAPISSNLFCFLP